MSVELGLGIEEVAACTPFSKSSLYRIAPREDSPFTKRCGKWVTTPERLREWIESGPKPKGKSENPMPTKQDFMAEVIELRRA